ncbi:MAG: polysaccharide pyruvyl transferase family protein [Cyanobacteria bacterium P01_H01_bin.35]
MDNPSLQHLSLSFLHSGIYQLQKYRLIITNRLHGHILCVLLNIPHIFLPNSYHKNQGFYETWSYDIPFCRFVSDITQDLSQILLRLKQVFKNFWYSQLKK